MQVSGLSGLLFSDITKLEEAYFEYDFTALKECAKMQSNPELINDGAETAPSKRIINCINRELYARDERDALLLFVLRSKWTILDANELLFSHGFAALGAPPE